MRSVSVAGLAVLGFGFLASVPMQAQRGAPGAGGGGSPIASLSLGGSHDNTPHVHQRTLEGFVRDANGKPLQNAVVYLKNTRTNQVDSVIADDRGGYRFGDLDLSADYQLWAQSDKKKSAEKTLSSFDTRDEVSLNLKIE